jgi:aromatic ring-cleaving dioxygenase
MIDIVFIIDMILSIPYQAFEIENVHLAPFQCDRYGKILAQLSYKDNSIDFQDISILSPPLRVIQYQPENSRLRLDLSEQTHFQNKLNTLQEYLVGTFFMHQQSFLNICYKSADYIRHLFYFLLDSSVLSLYIYPTASIKMADGQQAKITDLKPGDMIRVVIRLQGISQLINRESIRLRLHHSVPGVWLLP